MVCEKPVKRERATAKKKNKNQLHSCQQTECHNNQINIKLEPNYGRFNIGRSTERERKAHGMEFYLIFSLNQHPRSIFK